MNCTKGGDINCKKHDLVNKQIDTDCRQLDCKLCDLIFLLAALIFLNSNSSAAEQQFYAE